MKPSTVLRQAMRDLADWSEGDELLHGRFRPGSTVEDVGRRMVVVPWMSIQAPDGQSFGVGMRDEILVTQRTWYEGVDAWEAAGRPADPERQPQLRGMYGIERSLYGGDELAEGFMRAVLALHASIKSRSTGYGSAEREALADDVERAIHAIIRAELSVAGVPDWLLDASEAEAPGPRF